MAQAKRISSGQGEGYVLQNSHGSFEKQFLDCVDCVDGDQAGGYSLHIDSDAGISDTLYGVSIEQRCAGLFQRNFIIEISQGYSL
jgi:hypothetical protein